MNRALIALVLVPTLAACAGTPAPAWTFSGAGAYLMRVTPNTGVTEQYNVSLVDANGALSGIIDAGSGNAIPFTGSHSMVQAFPVRADLVVETTSTSSTCLNKILMHTEIAGNFTNANIFTGEAKGYSCQDASGGGLGTLVLKFTAVVEMTRK